MRVYYLYLLTGEVRYLSDFMDTLGACAQFMELNGHLRWGFLPDPYIKGKVCMERTDRQHDWHPVDSIVGEQYLDMISPWLRPDNENAVCAFGERGGAGDNTVQEIFKVMEECALTSPMLWRMEPAGFGVGIVQPNMKRGFFALLPMKKRLWEYILIYPVMWR